MPGRASLYVRLSREGGENSTSLSRQEEDLRALAERHSLAVVAVRQDDGVSGAVRSPPGLLAWLDDARSGRADHLLAWDMSRVTRGGTSALAEVLDVLDGVDRDGRAVSSPARLLTVRDALDSASAAWDLVGPVMAGMAKMERKAISDRIRSDKRRRKADGLHLGGAAPYGFRTAPNPDGPGKVLQVDPAESAALRQAAPHPRRRDPRLRGPVDDRAPSAAPALLRPPGPVVSRVTLRQSLTSDAARRLLWTAAERRALRAALEPRTRDPRRAARHDARLLSGLLSCHACGARLEVVRRTDGTVTYRCQTGAEGRACPSPVTVSALPVEAYVEAAFLASPAADFWHVDTAAARALVSERQAEVEERLETLWRAVAEKRGSERAGLLAEAEALEAERDDLAAAPAAAWRFPESAQRTNRDLWADLTHPAVEPSWPLSWPPRSSSDPVVAAPGASTRRGWLLRAWHSPGTLTTLRERRGLAGHSPCDLSDVCDARNVTSQSFP